MEKINQEDLKKVSNKVGLFFICEILSLILIIPILSHLGIYNNSNGFIFDLSIMLIVSCLFFPCDFKKMFLRKNKINMLEGTLYVFVFLSIYFPFAIIIGNLFSPLYPETLVEKHLTLGIFILHGIAVPIVEEIVYRGILLENLRKYGDAFAIVISALIFGMSHGYGILHTFLGGIFTGILYVKSNQLSYPILMHLFINLFSILLVSWIGKFFEIGSINIEFLILAIISIIIAFVLYIIAKKKNYSEIKNIKISQIKKIIPQLKQDKEKYKTFFQEGGVIFSLMLFIIIALMTAISKLK